MESRIFRSNFNKEPVITSWLNALSDTRYRTKSALKSISPWDVIVDLLRQKHNLLIGEPTAERAYYDLVKVSRKQPRKLLVKGRSLITGLPVAVEITSTEIQAADNSQETLPYMSWSQQGSDKTIGKLLYSIAAHGVNLLFATVLRQSLPEELEALFERDQDKLVTLIQGETVAQHWFRLNTVQQNLFRAYNQMSLEDFQRVRSVSDFDCSAEWVIHELCQFEAERRNEMTTLLSVARKALKTKTEL